MKRLSFLSSLCLVAGLLFQGCGSSGPQCDITVFPGGTNGGNYTATLLWGCDGYRDTRRVGFDGRVRVPQRCASWCGDIIVTSVRQIFTFSLSPFSIDLLSPPSSVTFSNGGGVDSTYGSPQVAYFDGYGTYIGAGQVTSWGSDWVVATVPDLSQVYSGSYTIQVQNMTSSGAWEWVGEGVGSAYNRDAPPSGGGGGGEGGGGCESECNMY
jgi:hypothetical protein